MSLQQVLSVNYGASRTGLGVGYTLIGADGVAVGSRITAGVVEVVSGVYQADVTYDDFFRGQILWDTGEATPLYAPFNIDYRSISEGAALAPGLISVGGGGLTKEEMKKLLEKLDKILKAVKNNKGLSKTIIEGVEQYALTGIHNHNSMKKNVNDLITKLETSISEASQKDSANKIASFLELNESLKDINQRLSQHLNSYVSKIEGLQESLNSVNIKIDKQSGQKFDPEKLKEVADGVLTIGTALEAMIDSQEFSKIVNGLKSGVPA